MTVEVRHRVRKAVATHLTLHAREIGQRTESHDGFPWKVFRA